MSLIDYQPRSPYRPPDWRWRKAQALRMGIVPIGRRPDPWLRRALRLQDRLDAPCGKVVPSRSDRGELGAYRVRHVSNPQLRRELEARVLAGQAGGAIADRCGLPQTVVEAYEAIFFDVRGRLDAPDYIAAVVIGLSTADGLPAGDLGSILRGYAYHGGPHVLDALLGVLDLGGPEGVGLRPAAPGEIPLARSIRTAILARSIPAAGRDAVVLARLQARQAETEREAASDVAHNAPIRAAFDPIAATFSPDRGCPPAPAASPRPGSDVVTDPDRYSPLGWPRIAAQAAVVDPHRFDPASRRTA